MAANTVSQTKRNLTTLSFGVRSNVDGALEHVVLAFDYATFVLNQHVEGSLVSSISFAEFKQVQTTGGTVSLFFNRGNPAVYTPMSEEDASNLYQLLDNIIDNIHEILSKDSTLIGNLCDSFKPKICLRHCTVTEKKFKRNKGKSKGIGFLKKPGKKKGAQEPAAGQRSSTKIHSGGSIGYIVMTEQHLLCFKDKKDEIPLYMFPLASCEFSAKQDDNSFSFKCMGTKGTFGLPDMEQKLLWMDTCAKSKSVSDNEVLDLEEKSQRLIRLLSTTFDPEAEEHVGMLRRLWDASQLEEEFCLKGNRWKDLGFQRDDPVSDFRATGLLGLENLVYMAEHYPELYLGMCKNQQQASEMEYPFATAGINITYLLMGLLHLSPDRSWYPDFVLHPFFFFDSNAWQELYVIVFRLFDQKWNQMQVGYMGYQEVIEATRESAEELIEKRSVMGVPAIFDMLGILRMDLPNFSTDAAQKSAKAEYSFPASAASSPDLTTAAAAGSEPTPAASGPRSPLADASAELSSSSPDLSVAGAGDDDCLPKSRSEHVALSDGNLEVRRTASQEGDDSLAPKPRKRRNTRSKTAVEQEEKDGKESKGRHRSRSRNSADKAHLRSLREEEKEGKEKEREERKGRDRHRSREAGKEKEVKEGKEKEKDRDRDREKERRKERKEERAAREPEEQRPPDDFPPEEEAKLRGSDRRKPAALVGSEEYEHWKASQGKAFAELDEPEEERAKAKKKHRGSFSLKRNSGIRKK